MLVLAVALPVLALLFRYLVAERVGIVLLSALVAHQGWHWLTERLETLSQFPWPSVTWADLPAILNWLMAATALAALVWLVSLALARWLPQGANARSESRN